MFKKITQIAWILIAVAFLILMYFHIRGSNIKIYRSGVSENVYYRIDKLTGSGFLLSVR